MTDKRIDNARKMIRNEIAEKNVNIKALAKKTGIAYKTVYNFLNGNVPKLSTFAALCEEFGLSADVLLGFDKER